MSNQPHHFRLQLSHYFRVLSVDKVYFEDLKPHHFRRTHLEDIISLQYLDKLREVEEQLRVEHGLSVVTELKEALQLLSRVLRDLNHVLLSLSTEQSTSGRLLLEYDRIHKLLLFENQSFKIRTRYDETRYFLFHCLRHAKTLRIMHQWLLIEILGRPVIFHY